MHALKTGATGTKAASLPDSSWPLCCTHSDEDNLSPLKVKGRKKERYGKKQYRCRHDVNERDLSTRRSLLTLSQTPNMVNLGYVTLCYVMLRYVTLRYVTLRYAQHGKLGLGLLKFNFLKYFNNLIKIRIDTMRNCIMWLQRSEAYTKSDGDRPTNAGGDMDATYRTHHVLVAGVKDSSRLALVQIHGKRQLDQPVVIDSASAQPLGVYNQ